MPFNVKRTRMAITLLTLIRKAFVMNPGREPASVRGFALVCFLLTNSGIFLTTNYKYSTSPLNYHSKHTGNPHCAHARFWLRRRGNGAARLGS